MPRVFIYNVLVFAIVVRAQNTSLNVQIESASDKEPQNINKVDANEELFKKLFVQRRKEHFETLRSLRKMDNYEYAYKMVTTFIGKMVEVIESSKSLIENADYSPSNSSFPRDSNVKYALSTILENTALFGDIVLYQPEITHRILRAQERWNAIMRWSLNFANQARHLLDKSTFDTLHLVRQKLNITKADIGYVTSYTPTANNGQTKDQSIIRKKVSTTKNKKKRGPQIVKIEL